MELLLISNEDTCRSRIAQELLNSFGRGMKITTCGITEGSRVPDEVCEVMMQKGYEVSRKKPIHVSNYLGQKWDYVITLSKEAQDELNYLNLSADKKVSYLFDDPYSIVGLDEQERAEQIGALYQDMYHILYEFYRDTLSEELSPRCTCGANTYCRCE